MALLSAVSALADDKPSEAMELVMTMPQGPSHDNALASVVAKWAARDPAAAAAAVTKMPPAELEIAAPQIAGALVRRDRERAAAWASALPSGRSHDLALSVICSAATGREASDAMQLAASIGEEEVRLEAMTAVAAKWFAADPDAAAAWITASSLPKESKRKLFATAGTRDR